MHPQFCAIGIVILSLLVLIMTSEKSQNCEVKPFQYGRQELLSFYGLTYRLRTGHRFRLDIDYTIKRRRIRKRWKRPRGRRGGSKNRRHIPVIMNVFSRTTSLNSRACALVPIRCQSTYFLKQCLNFTLWNARSMTEKLAPVIDSIVVNRTDIFIVTESWANDQKCTLIDADLTSSLAGFSIKHVPRKRRKGGGIAIISRTNLKITSNKCFVYNSFELMDINIKTGSELIHLLVIYRPPYSTAHKFTVNQFLSEFRTLLESVILSPGHLIIAGDLNIHVDNSDDTDAVNFLDLISSLGLQQHVVGPTHVKGHTLDLVLTRINDPCLANFAVDNTMPSDHAAIHFSSTIHRPPPSKTTKQHRILSSIDLSALKDSISSELNQCNPDDDVNVLVDCYNQALTQAIDRQAPLHTKVMTNKPRAPWFTNDLLEERQQLRQLERKWTHSKLEVHRQIFVGARKLYNAKLNEAKSSYFQQRISDADQRELFSIVDEISGCRKLSSKILPDIDCSILPDVFADFFVKKIVDIRNGLINDSDVSEVIMPSDSHSDCQLVNFQPLSEDDVISLVNQMSSKTCSLDPMPTNLVKKCIDVIAPTSAIIVNASFTTGIFPDSCKTAIVVPLIKKPSLDANVLKNYRPVSNCCFLDKFLEKAAFIQLNDYFSQNSLYGKYQSAYREGHSCETALLRVHNDVMLALDKQKDVILILLDLSAAFDTIDHDILLERLAQDSVLAGQSLTG